MASLLPGFARRRVALKDQQKRASVDDVSWESTLSLTRSLGDFEPKVFIRWPASRAQYDVFLAILPHRRPMAARRSRRRARGSIATAPGLNERPVLRWWCRSFPDSLAAHGALKDQQKRASVNHSCWESLLPLTRSLSDFEPKSLSVGAGIARPIRFLFSTFLFSDIHCAGDRWPSGDRAAELGGRSQQRPA